MNKMTVVLGGTATAATALIAAMIATLPFTSTAQATSTITASAHRDTVAPEHLRVPSGNKRSAVLNGRGVQVYQCRDGAWTLLEPAATLADARGRTVALHARGPVWVSTADGSAVTAYQVAKVEHKDAIPELLLKVQDHPSRRAEPKSGSSRWDCNHEMTPVSHPSD